MINAALIDNEKPCANCGHSLLTHRNWSDDCSVGGCSCSRYKSRPKLKYYDALVSFDVPKGVEITLTNRHIQLAIPGENRDARDELYAVFDAIHESMKGQMT